MNVLSLDSTRYESTVNVLSVGFLTNASTLNVSSNDSRKKESTRNDVVCSSCMNPSTVKLKDWVSRR